MKTGPVSLIATSALFLLLEFLAAVKQAASY
jgi:hypothetical protein